MATYYIVGEIGFEYNDEVYFRSEAGGVHPKLLFNREEDAEKTCEKENIKYLKKLLNNGDLAHYGYSLDEVVSEHENTDKIFNKIFGMSSEEWWEAHCEVKPIINPSEKDWSDLYNCFNLEFYEVVAVEKPTAFD